MIESVTILLVEDEGPKRKNITKYLAGLGEEVTVVVARSVNSALDELDKSKPDVMLLDMSLPTFDIGDREPGGRPQGFGGIEILRQMALAEIIIPTIVITGYEAIPRGEAGPSVDINQMRTELQAEFPEMFQGILHYNSTYDEWQRELHRLLNEIGILGDIK
jgi:CheY-like chemotaxis protein